MSEAFTRGKDSGLRSQASTPRSAHADVLTRTEVRSVQGLRLFRVLNDPDASTSRRELLEVRQRIERDLGRHDALLLDQSLHHPLGRDRRWNAVIDAAH